MKAIRIRCRLLQICYIAQHNIPNCLPVRTNSVASVQSIIGATDNRTSNILMLCLFLPRPDACRFATGIAELKHCHFFSTALRPVRTSSAGSPDLAADETGFGFLLNCRNFTPV